MRPPDRVDERGFVLIGIVWLLLLGTALVAALLLQARSASQRTADAAKLVQDRLDLDAATETVLAEMIMRGGASRWAALPSQGAVMIADRSISVAVTSEQGRLDLGRGSLVVIGQALQGLGIPPRQRDTFIERVKVLRSAGQIETAGQMSALLGMLQIDNDPGAACKDDLFTIASAMASPEVARAPTALQRAIGQPVVAAVTALRPGEAIRIEAVGKYGVSRRTSGRIIASPGKLAQRIVSELALSCADER